MVTQSPLPPVPTPAPTPAPSTSPDKDAALDAYMHLALESLADILRDTEASARDKRLAAGTMLKYLLALRPPAPSSPPAEPVRATSRPLSQRRQQEELDRERDAEIAEQNAQLADAYDLGYSDALDGKHEDPTAANVADAYTRGYTDAQSNKPRAPITLTTLAYEELARMDAAEDDDDPDLFDTDPASPSHPHPPLHVE